MLKEMFEDFNKINEKLDNKIVELSVKQSRITLSFDDMSLLKIDDIEKINSISRNFSVSEITAFQDVLHIHFSDLSEENLSDKDICSLANFYRVILILRDNLCTCPALEYIVSEDYLKIFIDLPNIKVKDVSNLDQLFNAEGFLELNIQRPYVLYVKDW